VKSQAHTLRVSGVPQPEPGAARAGSSIADSDFDTAEKEEVGLVAKDIRYIRTVDDGKPVGGPELFRRGTYWLLNAALLLFAVAAAFLSGRRATDLADVKGSRLRRSHSAARARLRAASRLMKEAAPDAFYAELSGAVTGYFADKFNISAQGLSEDRLEELASDYVTAEQLNKMKKLFDEMSLGRFSRAEKSPEHMKELYDLADEVIRTFEKVKLK
jgi:hypothetical protein